MIDSQLRLTKQKAFAPLTRKLESVSPITVTLIALLVGLIGVGFAALGLYMLALMFWLLNRTLDGLDGELARAFGKQSDLGGYIDILADFLIYAAVPVALVVANPSFAAWLALAVLLASFYLNSGSWMFLAALIEKRGRASDSKQTSITMPTGIIEGAETLVFYSLFLLLPQALVGLFYLMAALLAITVAQRIVWALHNLKD